MNRSWLFTISLGMLFLALFCLGGFSFFQVKDFQIEGNRKITFQELYDSLKCFQGENLLMVNLDEVRLKLSKDKRISQIQVARSWPSTLRVRIAEKEPVFLIKTVNLLGLASNGEILPVDSLENNQLPLVRGIGPEKLKPYSHPLVPDIELVLELYRAAQERGRQVLGLIKEIEVSKGKELVLTLGPGNTRALLGRDNYPQKVARLLEILGSETNPVALIDLRFENLGLVSNDTSPGT